RTHSQVAAKLTNTEQHGSAEGDCGAPAIAPRPVTPRHLRLALAQRKKRKIRKRIVGDKKEREHSDNAFEGIGAEEGNEHEADADDCAEEKRYRGSAAGVHLRGAAEK